jgi:hypothetical protein
VCPGDVLFGAFEIGCLVLDDSPLTHEPEPFLGACSLLGHNGNQLNALFHIELVLLYRLAIEAIGNFAHRCDITLERLSYESTRM